ARALNEVLSLVLRLAAESVANDGLGAFHRRSCRSNDVRALRASTSARSAACSGVSPEMKALRQARSSRARGESPLRCSSAATCFRHSPYAPGGAAGAGDCLDFGFRAMDR